MVFLAIVVFDMKNFIVKKKCSLNQTMRNREVMKIAIENQEILKRLESAK